MMMKVLDNFHGHVIMGGLRLSRRKNNNKYMYTITGLSKGKNCVQTVQLHQMCTFFGFYSSLCWQYAVVRLIHLLWSSTSSVGAAKNTKAPHHQLPAAPPGKKWRSIGNGFEEYYRERRVEEVEGFLGCRPEH